MAVLRAHQNLTRSPSRCKAVPPTYRALSSQRNTMVEQLQALVSVTEMVGQMWTFRSVIALVNLGVADELEKAPSTAEELAQKLKVHHGALFRIMRAAVYRGFLTVDPATRIFALTEKGAILTTTHPYSMVNLLKLYGSPSHWRVWEHPEHTIRTNEFAAFPSFQQDIWSYYRDHPDEDAIFSGAMTNWSLGEVKVIVEKYPFADGDPKVIVDVGGGHGALLAGILERMPSARAILFDLPNVVDNLPADAPASGHPRIELAGGSFLEPVIPAGGDVYILKHIIHDWYDEDCVTILKNIEKGMNPGGKVLVCEEPLTYGPEGEHITMLDVNMLVMIGGKERFLEEFERFFDQAGLKFTRVVSTGNNISVLEAHRK
ncbi:O-methyltransferase-domain-containing protein [Cladochytrium replicatum]|nr:O-methyltransferase-domain-containing protein [Cladochytrium replicatum]